MNKIFPIIAAAFSLVLFPVVMYGQKDRGPADCLPARLPAGLVLSEPKPVTYRMTADYYNQDIFGNFFNKNRISGLYTRALAGGKVQWNNVTIANAAGREDAFPGGARQEYMENLRYEPKNVMTDTAIIKKITDDNIFNKNLLWDMVMFESFAWLYFDSLQLNIPYHAGKFNVDVPLAGNGHFTNRDVRLTWSGITVINGKKCALIQFEAMDNPLAVTAAGMNAKGRSHYWGNIWVCLGDKQLEGAWMNEDVIMEVSPASSGKQLVNVVRRITLEKRND